MHLQNLLDLDEDARNEIAKTLVLEVWALENRVEEYLNARESLLHKIKETELHRNEIIKQLDAIKYPHSFYTPSEQ